MTKEQRQDEEILAKIIAGAKASGRRVMRGHFVSEHDEPFADDVPLQGACCAIGAGCLYADVPREGPDDDIFIYWPRAFATAHGTSVEYACGVSDGFEDEAQCAYSMGTCLLYSAEYLKGLEVGAAAYAALVEDAP